MPLNIYVGHLFNGISSNGTPRPYHWQIIVKLGTDRSGEPFGNVYYVSGSLAQGYVFQAAYNVRFRKNNMYRGRAYVGFIRSNRLTEMEDQLRQAEIRNFDEHWDPRSWVLGALRRLVAQGFQGDVAQPSPEMLAGLLRQGEERWEIGDD